MALFSRREEDRRRRAMPTADAAASPTAAPEPDATPSRRGRRAAAEAAASVGISVSSYRGLGARQRPAPASRPPAAAARSLAGPRRGRSAAEAPPPTETVPGLRDNVVLREALAALPTPPRRTDLLDVARQLLQGHLFLRVKGDARTLLAEGKDLPLGVVDRGRQAVRPGVQQRRGAAGEHPADGDTDTSAMGQPVSRVIRHVLAGPYAGLIIDHSSAPARAVLPRELLEKLVDQADESLDGQDPPRGRAHRRHGAAVAEALTRVPLWVAVDKVAGRAPRRRRGAHAGRRAAPRGLLAPAGGGVAGSRRPGRADDGRAARRALASRRSASPA